MTSAGWPPLLSAPPPERVLRLLVYFDIFTHPLSVDEICQLAFPGTPVPEVEGVLQQLQSGGRVEREGALVFLPGRGEAVALRREKAARAARLWADVPRSVRLLSAFPWVEGLSVTGTLAKDAVGEDADIDFVVFTTPGRVWLCRTLVASARRLFPEHVRERCCTNVFLDVSSLGYDQRTPYVAAEIGLSRPVYGRAVGEAFVRENDWLQAFLPGAVQPLPPPIPLEDPPLRRRRRVVERALGGRFGDAVERLLPEVWDRFWAIKYGHLEAGDRRRRFRVRAEVSTNHFNDFQARVLERYAAGLRAQGLEPGGPVAGGSCVSP